MIVRGTSPHILTQTKTDEKEHKINQFIAVGHQFIKITQNDNGCSNTGAIRVTWVAFYLCSQWEFHNAVIKPAAYIRKARHEAGERAAKNKRWRWWCSVWQRITRINAKARRRWRRQGEWRRHHNFWFVQTFYRFIYFNFKLNIKMIESIFKFDFLDFFLSASFFRYFWILKNQNFAKKRTQKEKLFEMSIFTIKIFFWRMLLPPLPLHHFFQKVKVKKVYKFQCQHCEQKPKI